MTLRNVLRLSHRCKHSSSCLKIIELNCDHLSEDMGNESHEYCVVLNIPSDYRSKHLRNYFNDMVESKAFNCFHFRHRPQNIRSCGNAEDNSVQSKTSKQRKRFCAIIDVKPERLNELFNKFNNKFWVDIVSGNDYNFKCFIKRIKLTDNNQHSNNDPTAISDKSIDLFWKTIETNSSAANRHINRELISRLKTRTVEKELQLSDGSDELLLSFSEVKSLRELRPPMDIMPNGNVGTPLEVFLQLIRECRLPAPVISKLELEFPKSMKRRIYSRVEYEYKNRGKMKFDDKEDKELDLVKTKNGLIINEKFSDFKRNETKSDLRIKEQKEDESDSDEDEVEEWDRHETLHDDVTQQERTRERLFEEEIELKWEKGGSGLVFYTDAQFWDLKDNCGDFDEKTVDDWDVDMNIYRKNCSADKDANDWKQMLEEMKLRKGKRKKDKYSIDSVCLKKKKSDSQIGSFEKHTKGFGRKIMEKQGWKCGEGLGSSVTGIPEPIDDSGQLPSDKRGFGYRGEKLQSFQFLKPQPK